MNVNPRIFKTYDIRGIYPTELDERVFYKLGKVFPVYLADKQKLPAGEKPKIIVGRDVRLSSPSLADSFVKGVLDSGFGVVDIGVVTTPMLYFGVIELSAFGGAIITASHNPPEYNGIKFVRQESEYIGGDEIQELYKMCIKEDDFKIFGNEKGKSEKRDISFGYRDFVSMDFNVNRRLKIVVDASCGTTALFLKDFLGRLKIDYIPLFFEPDGSFCNHDPNPLSEDAQVFVKKKIRKEKADFGIIFDGDGDRAVFVDENSNVLNGDVSGGIIADSFLKSGNKLGYVITSTRMLREHFEKKGIKTNMIKVGRYFINKGMRENDIDFSSEFSGHFYFKSFHYTESAFYALRLMLEVLDKNSGMKLSGLAKPFLKYFHSGEVNFFLPSRADWVQCLQKLKKYFDDGRQYFDDGILAEYNNSDGSINWWFNVRLSNTEPIARMVVEARTKELMLKKQKEILLLLGQKDLAQSLS